MMAWLFASGHAADLILGVLVIEGGWLRFRRGWSWRAILALLGPAALMMIGLRAAQVGADWWWIALPLAASLPLHLLDLSSRLSASRSARSDH